MSGILNQLRLTLRTGLRPVASVLRAILTPPKSPIVFGWQSVQEGPICGVEMLLPGGTDIADLIVSGQYESNVVALVQALVSSTDVCFDIGGHYGYYSMLLSRLASEGCVHTFEPVAEHAQRIQQGVERNALNNVTVHQAAVAGECGKMVLWTARDSDADDSMAYLEKYGGVNTPAAEEHYGHFSQSVVETVTLDSMAARLPAPDFIKIDAEGAEAFILQGGIRLVSQARPLILLELHGVQEALTCANFFITTKYTAILMNDRKVNLPVLLIPAENQKAIQTARDFLGGCPLVLFEQPEHR